MGAQKFTSNDKSLTFTASGEDFQKLEPDMMLHSIDLLFEPTLGVATADADSVISEGILDALGLITLRVDTEPRINVYARELFRLNQFLQGVAGNLTDPTGFVVATYSPRVSLRIPFAMEHALNPVETALRADRVNNLDLRLNFGVGALDLLTNTNGVLTFSGTVIPVLNKETIPRIPGGGRYVNADRKIGYIEEPVPATTTSQRINLTVEPGKWIRGIMLVTRDAGAWQDDIINTVTLVGSKQDGTGLERILDTTDWDALKDHAKINFKMASVPAGCVYIDFALAGKLKSAINTDDYSRLYFILDVTIGAGATDIRVVEDQVYMKSQVEAIAQA